MAFVPITEASLRSAMRDRRYWQSGHPEREAYVGWVTHGWHALEGSPHRSADGAAMVFVQAYSRVRDGQTEYVAAHWRSARPSATATIPVQDRGSVPPGYGQRVPGPQDPVGRSRSPIEISPGTNQPGTIQGWPYSGHALDRLQGRGLPPSVVENAIRPETFVGVRRGAHVYWDPGSRVMVVINPRTNTGITTIPRATRPQNLDRSAP
jgi:hypothetical protein